MLGRDHLSISIATIIPFLIPLFFINFVDVSYVIPILISIIIGSLLPDSDCKGKATIAYKFPAIDTFMRNFVGKPLVYVLNYLIGEKKIKVEHEVKDEHRGIIHSPLGILISTTILTLLVLIFSLLFGVFNLYVILSIFFGLAIGQLLHILEDSCTITGINWFFPFSTKELNGKIYTFSKDPEKKDIRPMLYSGILYAFSILLVIGFAFNKIQINIWLLYSLILLIVFLIWIFIRFLSKKEENGWLVKKDIINNFNKGVKRLEKT